MHTSTSNSGIISFVCLLSGFFSVLKIVHTASWSWFWVLAPIWITMLSVVVLFVIMGLRVVWVEFLRERARKVKSGSAPLETVA